MPRTHRASQDRGRPAPHGSRAAAAELLGISARMLTTKMKELGIDRMNHPTSDDVVAFLNERFAARGLPYRLDSLDVLPYMNPMWMANWELESAPPAEEVEIVEEEVANARWQFPQILGNW